MRKYITGSKILWTNPNPTSEFAAQSVSIDDNNYDTFEIVFMVLNNNSKVVLSQIIYKGFGTDLISIVANSTAGGMRSRRVNYSKGVLNFSDAYLSTGAANTVNNGVVVPLHIIGHNTGLF